MSYEVNYTSDFERSLKRIAKKQRSIQKDLLLLIQQLEQDPHIGVEIRPNLYKI